MPRHTLAVRLHQPGPRKLHAFDVTLLVSLAPAQRCVDVRRPAAPSQGGVPMPPTPKAEKFEGDKGVGRKKEEWIRSQLQYHGKINIRLFVPCKYLLFALITPSFLICYGFESGQKFESYKMVLRLVTERGVSSY